MSLEFAIIPITDEFSAFADDISNLIKYNVKQNTAIDIDTNYTSSLKSRINKWKKIFYNIVVIDQDYNQAHCVEVTLCGTKTQTMEINDFISLIASFEDEDNSNKATVYDNTTDNQDGGCIIV